MPSIRVLVIGQSPLSPAFGEPDDPMHRIVEPNALAHGIAEDRAEQCHGAPGDTTTAAYDRETAWLGLLPACRLAGSDVVHEAFDIIPPDRLHRHPPEQRDDVPRDPATVGDQRGLLFGDLPPGQQAASFDVGEVLPA